MAHIEKAKNQAGQTIFPVTVADAVLMGDGKTLKGELSELGSEVGTLNADVNGSEINYIIGKSVGSSGLEYDNAGWSHSGYIEYNGGDIEWNYGVSSSNQQIGLCTYDQNKEYISMFLASDSLGKRTLESSRSELIGAKYLRVSFNDSVIGSIVLKTSLLSYIPHDTINGIKNDLSDIKKIIGGSGEVSETYNSSILVYDELVDNNGQFHTSTKGSNRSDFIKVSKGDTIIVDSNNSADTNKISLYTEKSETSYVDGVVNYTGEHIYSVSQDGYIVVCSAKAYNSKFALTIKSKISINEALGRLDNEISNLESTINPVVNGYDGNYFSGKSVGSLGVEYDNAGWNCSDYIPYSGGDIVWTYGESSPNQQIALCTYNGNREFIDKFLASDTSGKRTITSDRTELVGAAYLRASFNDSVIGGIPIKIGSYEYKPIENKGSLEERVEGLERRVGEEQEKKMNYSSDILTFSDYVDNNGLFHSSSAGSNRSDFIRVFKGDVIEVDSSNSDDTNKISLYSEQNTSSFVVGVKNYVGELTYEVPRDGYIVVCSSRSYNDSFSLVINRIVTLNVRVKILEDGIDYQKEYIKPSDIPIFEPSEVTDDFICDVGYDKAYINTDHQTFLNDYYDKYAFKYYNDYSVIKYTLGMDAAQDGHEIFCYEFAPKQYSKTVLLSSGMNCCELAPILGVAYFIKSLMEDYSNDVGLKWMRENVRFVVIPFICPSSFDAVPCLYTNANDVRINKNFNYRKSWFTMSNFAGLPGTKGDAPDSEIETKILKQWISSYRGASLWIDCHADLSIDQPNKLIEVFYSDYNTGTKVKSTFNKIKQFYVDKGYITDPSSVVMNGSQEVNTFPKTLYSYNEIGIPALMIEQWALSVVYGSDPTKQCDSYAIKNYVTLLHQYIMSCV